MIWEADDYAGAPSLDFQTWDYAYDGSPTIMTLPATCAIGEVSQSPSYYCAEQYDSDLGLYYLRARYYNPVTGRFLSRDPEDGKRWEPATLHKYLYADGDPVNGRDPSGRGDVIEFGDSVAWETRKVYIYQKTIGWTARYFLCIDAAVAAINLTGVTYIPWSQVEAGCLDFANSF